MVQAKEPVLVCRPRNNRAYSRTQKQNVLAEPLLSRLETVPTMNRRDVVIGGVAGIAAAVAVPIVAKAEEATTEDSELDPIRALLDAYDAAFSNHDLDGVLASFSAKAAIMGTGPGEIWSGPDEIRAAHQRFFDGFDYGAQSFQYEFSIGQVKPDEGWAWMMTSGNVEGKKGGEDFAFPVNISITASKDGGKWLITTLHFSTFTDQATEES
jgi:uncharacterized protein (TIGR02246 family)